MTKHLRIPLLALAALVVAAVPVAEAKQARSAATVNVTAGKPSEFKFSLSVKTVKHGAVTFSVTNNALTPHDFKVCSAPVKNAAADTCKGRATPLLSPGQKATLKVTFPKAGTYEYLCNVPGHATAGMKGLLKVT